MKRKKSEFQDNSYIMDKIEFDGLHGVAYVQTIGNTETKVGSQLVQYTIAPLSPTHRKRLETRPHREQARREGLAVAPIKEDALRDELAILIGAAMSTSDVVRALLKFIKLVKRDGMWIGNEKGYSIIEHVNGSLTYDG